MSFTVEEPSLTFRKNAMHIAKIGTGGKTVWNDNKSIIL